VDGPRTINQFHGHLHEGTFNFKCVRTYKKYTYVHAAIVKSDCGDSDGLNVLRESAASRSVRASRLYHNILLLLILLFRCERV